MFSGEISYTWRNSFICKQKIWLFINRLFINFFVISLPFSKSKLLSNSFLTICTLLSAILFDCEWYGDLIILIPLAMQNLLNSVELKGRPLSDNSTKSIIENIFLNFNIISFAITVTH